MSMILPRACILPRAALGLLLLGLPPAHTTAFAVDTMMSTDAPDLRAVRAKIQASEWPAALTELTQIASTVQHADVYNLLGFVNRNMGEHKAAFTFYKKALDFDPKHKGAHEYLGELFVKTGNMAKAREHEVVLAGLCPTGCEELEDLRKAIAAGPPAGASVTN
jgi:tetratricopeptide (TPR) repeat protein